MTAERVVNGAKKFSEFFIGKDCKLCAQYGVQCHDNGLSDFRGGRSVYIMPYGYNVYIRRFVSETTIDGCEAVKDPKQIEATAAEWVRNSTQDVS